MGFVKVAKVHDLAPGEMSGVMVGDKPTLLANVDGRFYAIHNVCKHLGCTLSKGKLNGNIVTCPCHGSQYDVTTGQFTRGPTIRSEEAHRVTVEGDDVLVEEGFMQK